MIADNISRIKSNLTGSSLWKLFQDHVALIPCKRFYLQPDSISDLMHVVLLGQSPPPQQLPVCMLWKVDKYTSVNGVLRWRDSRTLSSVVMIHPKQLNYGLPLSQSTFKWNYMCCKIIEASRVNLYLSDSSKLAIFKIPPDPRKIFYIKSLPTLPIW